MRLDRRGRVEQGHAAAMVHAGVGLAEPASISALIGYVHADPPSCAVGDLRRNAVLGCQRRQTRCGLADTTGRAHNCPRPCTALATAPARVKDEQVWRVHGSPAGSCGVDGLGPESSSGAGIQL
jgi:hypothetical protein